MLAFTVFIGRQPIIEVNSPFTYEKECVSTLRILTHPQCFAKSVFFLSISPHASSWFNYSSVGWSGSHYILALVECLLDFVIHFN